MTKLSVVIPVYNAEAYLAETVTQFADLPGLETQIICVNDCSKDNSAKILRDLAQTYPNVEALNLRKNGGAGVARNKGLERVTGDYVYFFDADDIVHPDTLLAAVEIAVNTQVDVVMCGYILGEAKGATRPMHKFDATTFDKELGNASWVILNSKQSTPLCSTTNYPWNKILRADYARRIKLRFGETIVHNDILGHWMTLLFAQRVALFRDVLCTHIVPAHGSNLTNINDNRRLSVFQAIAELDVLIENHPELNARALLELTRFKVTVLRWAKRTISPQYRDEFDGLAKQAFRNIGVADFFALKKRWPGVAREVAKFRFGQ